MTAWIDEACINARERGEIYWDHINQPMIAAPTIQIQPGEPYLYVGVSPQAGPWDYDWIPLCGVRIDG